MPEVFHDRRHVLIFLHEFIEQAGDRHAGHIALELAHFLTHFPRPLRRRAHDLLQALGQRRDVVMEFLLFLLGEFLELLAAERLTFSHRYERNAGGCLDYPDVLGLGFLLDFLERLFLGILEFLRDGLPLGLEVLAFESRRNGRLSVRDDLLHIDSQFLAAARRQCQDPRLARIVEVVDVTPILRHGTLRRFLLQETAHEHVTARAGWPQYVDVVPVDIDLGSETHGLEGPVLPRNFAQVLQFGRGVETQRSRIAARVQCVGRQWFACFEFHCSALRSGFPPRQCFVSRSLYPDMARSIDK